MTLPSTAISYELTGKQRLAAHCAVWMFYRQGTICLLLFCAIVIALSLNLSVWFLLLLLLPPFNNLFRLIGGFVIPLYCKPMRLEVVIEDKRMAITCANKKRWLLLEELNCIGKTGDFWVLLGPDGDMLSIPVAEIEDNYIDKLIPKVEKR